MHREHLELAKTPRTFVLGRITVNNGYFVLECSWVAKLTGASFFVSYFIMS